MNPQDFNKLGVDLFNAGDMEGSRLHHLAALREDNFDAAAMASLALVACQRGDLCVAEIAARRALEAIPDSVVLWEALGNTLTRQGRFLEAEVDFHKALAFDPQNVSVLHNIFLWALRQRKYEYAKAYAERVRGTGKVEPGFLSDEAHLELAFNSNLTAALTSYEARWAAGMTRLAPWHIGVLEWQGEPLRGKRILLHGEQGLGDSIMCARFVKTFRDRGAHVTLCVPNSLVRLFAQQEWCPSVLSIEHVHAGWAERFDFHSPMFSAIRWLGIQRSDISPAPYLTLPESIPRSKGFNIGLCWASGVRGTAMDEHRREVPLELFLPLAQDTNVRLWSLQKGQNEDDITRLGAEPLIFDPTKRFRDFYDTARFMLGLDLVVTVDSAVAHLAGALGVPAIVLCQFTPCWRWWNIENSTGEPWYKSLTLVRQRRMGDWTGTVSETIELVWNVRKIARAIAA